MKTFIKDLDQYLKENNNHLYEDDWEFEGEIPYIVFSYDPRLKVWGVEGEYETETAEEAEMLAKKDNARSPIRRTKFTAREVEEDEAEEFFDENPITAFWWTKK